MKTILRMCAAVLLMAGMTFVASGSASAATPNWLSVSAGGSHTCAIATNHSLYCWGNNDDGELGIGPSSDTSVPTKVGTSTNWVSVSAGDGHTCARHNSGSLYCWGNNGDRQLGLGHNDSKNTPQKVVTSYKDWVSLDTGNSHTCARRAAGSLYCWGRNSNGELGLGDTDPRNTLARVAVSTNWTSFSVGGAKTCARHTSGSLYCWGSNGQGQLGIGQVGDRSVPTKVGTSTNWVSVSAGQIHVCAKHNSGSLYCWGYDASGQLGNGGGGFGSKDTPQKVVGNSTSWVSVSAGDQHTCAQRASGSLYCWGEGASGRLGVGVGDAIDRSSPTLVAVSTNWTSVSAGGGHTCARHASGSAYCWGNNDSAQLGVGGIAPRTIPTKVG